MSLPALVLAFAAAPITQMLIVAFLGLLAAYYFYSSKTFGIFKQNGIPGPTPKPFLANFLDLSRYFFLTDRNLLEKYSNGRELVGYHEGVWPILIVAKPEIVREVMVKEFNNFPDRRNISLGGRLRSAVSIARGDDWKRIRPVLSPAFSSGKLRRLMPLVQHCAELVNADIEQTKLGESVECKAFRSLVLLTGLFLPSLATWLSNRGFSAFPDSSLTFFETTIKKVIQSRSEELSNGPKTKNSAKRRNDFLDILLASMRNEDDEAHDEDIGSTEDTATFVAETSINKVPHSNGTTTEANGWQSKRKRDNKLSDEEIVAQAVIFLIAAYDTTSSTIAFFINALATHPEVQDRLREEINKAHETSNDEQLSYEQIINGLPYLDQCIQETLRVWPVVTRTERGCVNDIDIGGVHIPAGVVVAVPIYYLHHQEKYWPQPEEWNPERFAPEAKMNIVPFTYLPFGQGPRNCVGMRFALLEMKVLLATLVHKFHILSVDKTERQPELEEATGLMKAKNGLWVKFEKI